MEKVMFMNSRLLKIGDIEVGAGEKVMSTLKVAERSVSSIEVPITIVNGNKDGPTLCVIAGEHGNEYAGIETCIRLSKDLSPRNLAGALILIPIVNIPGFQERSPYVNPIDKVNIADVWPGRPNGSITEIIAYNIFHNVIAKSTYLIRLHGGDICESMIPCVYYSMLGDEKVDKMAKELATIFGMEYVIEYSPPPKLHVAAGKLGIPTILPEAGHEGKIREEDVKLLYDGVLNVMKYLGMIPGKSETKFKPKIIDGKKMMYVTSKTSGLFYSYVEVGNIVHKGDIIGEIRNIKGECLDKITAPIDGKIFFKYNSLPWDPTLGWFLFQIVQVDSLS
jgi:predicted deacylase